MALTALPNVERVISGSNPLPSYTTCIPSEKDSFQKMILKYKKYCNLDETVRAILSLLLSLSSCSSYAFPPGGQTTG